MQIHRSLVYYITCIHFHSWASLFTTFPPFPKIFITKIKVFELSWSPLHNICEGNQDYTE